MGNEQMSKDNPEKEIIFNNEAHKKYFHSIFKKLKKAENKTPHHLTSYYFVVNSLMIINEITNDIKIHVIEFVMKNAVIENKRGFSGFGKDYLKDLENFDENLIEKEANKNEANIPHIASTYSALSILCLFNLLNKKEIKNLIKIYLLTEEIEFSVNGILNHIEKSRREEGNINCQNWDCENDVRFFYCACAIKKYMEIYEAKNSEINFNTIEDKEFFLNDEKSKKYLNSLQNYEGGFSMQKKGESQAGLTYCALASYKLLNFKIPNSDKVLFWLVNRITNFGVNGRTGKVPDSCYSFWSFGSLSILNKQDFVDKKYIKDFLLNCQCEVGGFSKFLNDENKERPDLLHSFYSLASLALLR